MLNTENVNVNKNNLFILLEYSIDYFISGWVQLKLSADEKLCFNQNEKIKFSLRNCTNWVLIILGNSDVPAH